MDIAQRRRKEALPKREELIILAQSVVFSFSVFLLSYGISQMKKLRFCVIKRLVCLYWTSVSVLEFTCKNFSLNIKTILQVEHP